MDDLTISLSLPARAEFLSVARAVVGAAALRLDFTYEGLDDLRLAVDEAATRLVLLAPGDTLTLEITPRGRVVEARLSIGSPEAFPSVEEREALAWNLMTALVDEVDAGGGDGRAWITLIKHATT